MAKYSNGVRFVVKDGNQEALIKKYLITDPNSMAFSRSTLIQTGDKIFCSVGIWEDEASLVKTEVILERF